MPLPRMTTRRWLIAVAVASVLLAILRLRMLANDYWRDAGVYEVVASFLSVDGQEAKASHFNRLAHNKYRHAARRPWLPVPPDPPEPK